MIAVQQLTITQPGLKASDLATQEATGHVKASLPLGTGFITVSLPAGPATTFEQAMPGGIERSWFFDAPQNRVFILREVGLQPLEVDALVQSLRIGSDTLPSDCP